MDISKEDLEANGYTRAEPPNRRVMSMMSYRKVIRNSRGVKSFVLDISFYIPEGGKGYFIIAETVLQLPDGLSFRLELNELAARPDMTLGGVEAFFQAMYMTHGCVPSIRDKKVEAQHKDAIARVAPRDRKLLLKPSATDEETTQLILKKIADGIP